MTGPEDISPHPDRLPDDLAEVAARLERERPVPSAGFRAMLGSIVRAESTRTRPPHVHRLIAAYLATGLVLLAIAAIGLAGAGPFAADHHDRQVSVVVSSEH